MFYLYINNKKPVGIIPTGLFFVPSKLNIDEVCKAMLPAYSHYKSNDISCCISRPAFTNLSFHSYSYSMTSPTKWVGIDSEEQRNE
jgi:hypothetical protein